MFTWSEILPTLCAVMTLIALVYTAKRYDNDQHRVKQTDDTAIIKQLAVLETKVDNLATIVNKHNNVIERTYNVERDSKTMWNRIDENRETISMLQKEIEEIKVNMAKVGGTD